MSRLTRILRWLGGGIGILAAVALSVFLYAPYADGPLGPLGYIAGGRLHGPVEVFPDDPTAWAELPTVELETNPTDPRSVTVGLLVVDGVAFVPATLSPETKRWPRDVGRDASVREEPETAANMPHPRTLTCKSPPGRLFIQGAKPVNMSFDSRDRNNISPIQMKSGKAARAQELLAPHTVVASTGPTGASVKKTMPTIPAPNNDKATHRPLPNRVNSTKTSSTTR